MDTMRSRQRYLRSLNSRMSGSVDIIQSQQIEALQQQVAAIQQQLLTGSGAMAALQQQVAQIQQQLLNGPPNFSSWPIAPDTSFLG